MAGDGPRGDGPVGFTFVHDRHEPGPKGIQDEQTDPLMPEALGILWDVAYTANHPRSWSFALPIS